MATVKGDLISATVEGDATYQLPDGTIVELGANIVNDNGHYVGRVTDYDYTEGLMKVNVATSVETLRRFKLKEELLSDEDMKSKLQTMSLLGLWRDVMCEPDLTIDDLSDRELQAFNLQKNVLRKYQDELQNKQ